MVDVGDLASSELAKFALTLGPATVVTGRHSHKEQVSHPSAWTASGTDPERTKTSSLHSSRRPRRRDHRCAFISIVSKYYLYFPGVG